VAAARIPFPVEPAAARLLTSALLGLIDLEEGPTQEQRHVLELFAEALERGARCRGDFSQLDHLALAAEPLREIRRRFHVLPLRQPMVDQPDLWPDPSEL
jgi:hypothetical protein